MTDARREPTAEEQRVIRQGELLQKEMALIRRILNKYAALHEELHAGLSELAPEMYRAGVPLEQAQREYVGLDNALAGPADFAFTRAYLNARQEAETDPEVPAT